jgi:hypothetical protein
MNLCHNLVSKFNFTLTVDLALSLLGPFERNCKPRWPTYLKELNPKRFLEYDTQKPINITRIIIIDKFTPSATSMTHLSYSKHDLGKRVISPNKIKSSIFYGYHDPWIFDMWIRNIDQLFEWHNLSGNRRFRFAKITLIGEVKF